MKKTLKAAAPSVFCLLCGNDLQPVAVRVGDKIAVSYTHLDVYKRQQPGLDEHAADQKNEKQLGNLLR